MGAPSKQKTWSIAKCVRIPFVSLNGTMAAFLFGIKQHLKTVGYTVKGSCDGTTGAMDAVDRWATAANATTRGAAAGNAQSWIVLTDGQGVNILFTYQGASDDIAKVSFSPTGVFVAAGTPANQPTATDEQVVTSAASLIANTASGDRLYSVWASSDAKMFRAAVARGGVWVGKPMWVEEFTPIVEAPMSLTPPVWGGSNAAGNGGVAGGTTIGACRPIVSGSPVNSIMQWGLEVFGNNSGLWGNAKPHAQGATGYPTFPLSIGSNTAGALGKYGDLIDCWLGRTTGGTAGDDYASLQFIGMTGYAGDIGGVWPWDGATTIVMT